MGTVHEHPSAESAGRSRQQAAAPMPVAEPAPRVLSGGRPLPPTTRERMEAAFGVPLEHIRLHTDAEADEIAEEHEAEALTVGSHIAFAAARFDPDTDEGEELLAHELAHVVQRGGGEARLDGPDSEPGEPAEREAYDAAARVARGEPAGVTPGAAVWTTRARIMRRARAAGPGPEPTPALGPSHDPEPSPDPEPAPAEARAARAARAEPVEAEPQDELEAEEETAALAPMTGSAVRQVAIRVGGSGSPMPPDVDATPPSAESDPAVDRTRLVVPTQDGRQVSEPARTVEPVARGPTLAGVVQTKLTVSSPGDPLERDADLVSAHVLRGTPARSRPPRGAAPIRGPPGATHGLPRSVASVIVAPGGGRPLDPAVRGRIEPHLGIDLGHVRIRQGPDAAAAAHDLHARAFTSGSTIFLAAGSSPADIALMAHEATHVAQQETVAGARTTLMRDVTDYLPDVSVSDVIPDWILDGVRETIRAIPGYVVLTYITGRDPLSDEPAPASPQELVEALLTFGPFGAAVGTVLQAIDVLGEIFDFVREELAAQDLTLARVQRDIASAWDELSIANGIAGNVAIVRRYVDALLQDVRAFVGSIVERVLEIVRSVVVQVAEPMLERPEIAPLWNLVKKVLRYDPLRGVSVEAPTVEIIADFLRLIGEEERLAQIQERGTLQATADWLDTQLGTFASLVTELGTLFSDAWEAIQPENLPDLLTNLEGLAWRAFGFIQRVGGFAATLIVKVLELIKDSLLGWLSQNAHSVPGFHLLTVILGQNPFTGEEVPRTAENLIKGFITLLPGGEETYNQLAESGVISSAAERIEGEMTRLGISLELITGIFLGIWNTLTLDDLLDPLGAFARIIALFGEPISRLIAFIVVVIEVVVTLILRLMNFPSELLGRVISNTLAAINDIKRDPVAFLLNMVEALKVGFTNFFANIGTYLIDGLVAWLFRGLGQLGVKLPTDFTLASILDLIFQVLGLTAEHLWEKLGEHIGPERVQMIRGALDKLAGAWAFIQDVQREGFPAIWRYVQDQLGAIWSTLLSMATEWIMQTIIVNATVKLLSFLDPTGIMAIINGCIAFFNAVMSAIEYLRDMLEVLDRYVSTLAAVAAGNIVPGAQMLEMGLASIIPIAIGFLAKQVGLGNVPDKIVELIGRLREIIDKAIDWLIGQALRLGQAALNALGLGSKDEPAETATPTGDGQWVYEHPEGGHMIRISPKLEVFRFSDDPTLLTGPQADAQKQAALETLVSRTPLAYPTDGLNRPYWPSGFVEKIKEKEARASMVPAHNVAGGIAAFEPGDVRGHLIGDRFHGPGDAENLVPMHTTLNGSTFLSYETQIANAYKAAKSTGGAALLEMSIQPNYPADDPAAPHRKFRPTTVTAASTVYSLDPAAGALRSVKQDFPGSFGNPSDAAVVINLNTASREEILAAYKGTITPDVHRLVDAIMAVRRPGRELDFFMLELGERLGTKLDIFEQMIGSRAPRFVVG
jgi:hypothetical protein